VIDGGFEEDGMSSMAGDFTSSTTDEGGGGEESAEKRASPGTGTDDDV
jgi:hypothetical protein